MDIFFYNKSVKCVIWLVDWYQSVQTWYLGVYSYFDPYRKLFGSDHLPYTLTALVVLTLFLVFPLSLLLCYQCKAMPHQMFFKGKNTGWIFINIFSAVLQRWQQWHILLQVVWRLLHYYQSSWFHIFPQWNCLTCVQPDMSIIGAIAILMVDPYKEGCEYSWCNIFIVANTALCIHSKRESVYHLGSHIIHQLHIILNLL